MKRLIIDNNNISSISYHRARQILIGDIASKQLSEEEKIKYIENTFVGLILYIYFNILHKYLRDYSDHEICIVWDGRNGSAWRKERDENYKSNRDHSKDIYYNSFIASMIAEQEILSHYPVRQFLHENVEADDIIYNLCEIHQNEPIVLISSDGDFLQLLQKFTNIKIWNPKKKEFSATPDYDVVLYKAIAGDSSDVIKGLYKYGPKKALKTIQNGLKDLTDEQRAEVENNKIIIDLSLNPHVKKNRDVVIQQIKDSKITMSLNSIKKLFFKYKMAEFLKKWDSITEILRQLMRESNNGGEKEC